VGEIGERDVNGSIAAGSCPLSSAMSAATSPWHSLPWHGPVPKPV
jgi:hypothetical protein